MTKLGVQVTTYGENSAYHQLLTGFILLERSGVIDLELRFLPNVATHPTPSIVEAIIADRIKVAYDVEDGYIVDWSSRDQYLEGVDLCFKRSFEERSHSSSRFASKFRPLGLVYDATVRHPFLRWRRMDPQTYVRTVVKRVIGREIHPQWSRFENVPRVADQPRVLFAARVWDPRGEKGERIEDLGAALADRQPLNDMRADCVRLLRRRLGPAFVGGLVPTAYALEAYPDCVTDKSVTNRRSFLSLVKEADICVATLGLFGSNGYKVGEYVAASRAIITERLRYAIPGDFTEGRNYLAFDDPEQCAQLAVDLIADRGRIYALQAQNYAYYQDFVRPDRLVLNSLKTAVQEAPPDI